MIIRRLYDWPTSEFRSPFDELELMRRQMDRLSDTLWGGAYREPAAGIFPIVNVTEDHDHYYIRAELPGVSPGDLDISVTGNGVSISGERKIEAGGEDVVYHRREREGGKFSRMVSLPKPIDASKVDAHCADGILKVVLPKAESAKPKQIQVKTS
jgi:HSP20 family protein